MPTMQGCICGCLQGGHPGGISGSSPLKGIVVWINSGMQEPPRHWRHWEGFLEFPVLGPPLNCGQHLCSILQGILAKCHQAFDCLVVGSQGVGDVLGMTLDVALGPLSHLFLQLEEL